MATIKKWDMKLSDYNITHAKYNELKYFCMHQGIDIDPVSPYLLNFLNENKHKNKRNG